MSGIPYAPLFAICNCNVKLYAVELCNSQVVYVLESEMELLEQTSIMVVDTIIFNGPEESKPVRSSTPEKNLGPGGLFHMKFAYQPNGNIDELYWQMAGRAISEYDMSYDPLNRMTNAQYAEYFNNGSQRTPANAYGVNGIGYDEDGNIETLKRRGLTGYCENGLPEYGPIDDLAYTYHASIPNRLTSVNDGADLEKGFTSAGGGEYSYDGAGNLTSDPNKGLSIQYNHLNLPKTITGNGGSIEIIYDAAGRKLRKIVTSPDDTYTFDYISGIEFRDGELEAVYHQEGRFFVPKAEEGQEAEDPRHEFFLKDHLGNTRLVIADRDGSGGIDPTEDPATNELLQENHYYPFGMNQEGPWAQPFVLDDQGEITLDEEGKPVVDQVRLAKYQYNGIERNEDLGLNWDLATFRSYDAAIGRWMQVDPRAEKYYGMTPYNGMGNNPIKYADVNGDSIRINGVTYMPGDTYDGDDKFVQYVFQALDYIVNNEADVTDVISYLAHHEKDLNILRNTEENNPLYKTPGMKTYFNDNINEKGVSEGDPFIIWAPGWGLKFDNYGIFDFGGERTPAEALLHELGHAKSYFEDPFQHYTDSNKKVLRYTNEEERQVIWEVENPGAIQLRGKNASQRNYHGGWFYPVIGPTSLEKRKIR